MPVHRGSFKVCYKAACSFANAIQLQLGSSLAAQMPLTANHFNNISISSATAHSTGCCITHTWLYAAHPKPTAVAAPCIHSPAALSGPQPPSCGGYRCCARSLRCPGHCPPERGPAAGSTAPWPQQHTGSPAWWTQSVRTCGSPPAQQEGAAGTASAM